MRKTIFIIMFILSDLFVIGQNNSISTFAFTNMFSYARYRFATINYDRKVSTHISLGLTVFGTQAIGDEDYYNSYGIVPMIKYNLTSKNKFVNHTWFSFYNSFSNNRSSGYDYDIHTRNIGPGLSIGKRIFVFKAKKWFIDIGIGCSFKYTIYKKYYSFDYYIDKITGQWIITNEEFSEDPTTSFIPWPIFRIGRIF